MLKILIVRFYWLEIIASKNKMMRFKPKLNLPQESILGFKVLSSFNSSIACYIFLIIGKLLNPLFGFSKQQIIAGSLFNIVLNLSIVILIINLISKRKELQTSYFILLNSILFICLPNLLYSITKYAMILLDFLILKIVLP